VTASRVRDGGMRLRSSAASGPSDELTKLRLLGSFLHGPMYIPTMGRAEVWRAPHLATLGPPPLFTVICKRWLWHALWLPLSAVFCRMT
jgi:hypothetical protein